MIETEPVKETVLRARLAAERASLRARTARWDVDIVIFLFAILALVVILVSEEVAIEIVAPIAIFALALCWFMGWRRGRELYEVFLDEELSKLRQDLE